MSDAVVIAVRIESPNPDVDETGEISVYLNRYGLMSMIEVSGNRVELSRQEARRLAIALLEVAEQ